jgi:hypothetical protein
MNEPVIIYGYGKGMRRQKAANRCSLENVGWIFMRADTIIRPWKLIRTGKE